MCFAFRSAKWLSKRRSCAFGWINSGGAIVSTSCFSVCQYRIIHWSSYWVVDLFWIFTLFSTTFRENLNNRVEPITVRQRMCIVQCVTCPKSSNVEKELVLPHTVDRYRWLNSILCKSSRPTPEYHRLGDDRGFDRLTRWVTLRMTMQLGQTFLFVVFFAFYACCDLKRRRLGDFVSYMWANIDRFFSYLVMLV